MQVVGIFGLVAAGLAGLETHLETRTYKATAYFVVCATIPPWNATETSHELRVAIDQYNLVVVANVSCGDPITRLEDVVVLNPHCGVRMSSITQTIANDPLLPARSAILAIRTFDEIEIDEAAFPPTWFTVSTACIAIGGAVGIMSISLI
jgi:hypothetical protein